MKQWIVLVAAGVMLLGCSGVWAGDDGSLQAEVASLQGRVADLEAQLVGVEPVGGNSAEIARLLREVDGGFLKQAQGTGLTAGHDKRFFIKSIDDQFKLEFDTLFQMRYSYLRSDSCSSGRPNGSGNAFELERARLALTGQVLKDVDFKIQLEMDDDAENRVELLDYYIAYSFAPEVGVRAGRGKAAFGKQENVSAGRQMMIDRSLANEVFNIGRTTGVELFGEAPCGDVSAHWRVGLFNGFGDAKSSPFSDNDNNPALAGRIVVPLMGSTPADFANESDLRGHEHPVVQLGGSIAYTDAKYEDRFSGGGGEDDNYSVLLKGASDLETGAGESYQARTPGEVLLLGLDVAMKHEGLAVVGEIFYQHANMDGRNVAGFDDILEENILLADEVEGLQVDNFGWTLQAGYFMVAEVFELVSRVGGVCVDNSSDAQEYAAGWNWYLAGQDLKLSMDITYVDDLLINSGGANYLGALNKSLFLTRMQLQFQF